MEAKERKEIQTEKYVYSINT